MAYRDDHQAALEQAAALERELERARSEHAHDQERIRELERQLAAARDGRPDPAPVHAGKAHPQLMAFLGALLALAIGLAVYGLSTPEPLRELPVRVGDAPAPPGSRFDVQQGLREALALAQHSFADAELVSIEADHVDADGLAHLEEGGVVEYRFRSPLHAEKVGGANCRGRAVVSRDHGLEWRVVHGLSTQCGRSLAGLPRCSASAVWARAAEREAPTPALAHLRLGFTADATAREWTFSVDDLGKTTFSTRLADDCR